MSSPSACSSSAAIAPAHRTASSPSSTARNDFTSIRLLLNAAALDPRMDFGLADVAVFARFCDRALHALAERHII
jgi:hypothetical protein